jgi:hypothetical protein
MMPSSISLPVRMEHRTTTHSGRLISCRRPFIFIVYLPSFRINYSNNDARSEDLVAAIEVDRKLEKAWAGHPHHIIIDNHNGKSFDTKLEELVSSISYYVGLPSLTKASIKYILLEVSDPPLFCFMTHFPTDLY